MKYTRKKIINLNELREEKKQNLKVLYYLRKFIYLLNQYDAIIGRDNKIIVVNLNLIPFCIEDEICNINCNSTLISNSSVMHIFPSSTKDGDNGYFIMHISGSIFESTGVCTVFPELVEVRKLLKKIPFMSQDESDYFKILEDAKIEKLLQPLIF